MNLIRERKSSIIYSLLLVFLLIPFFKPDIVTSFQKINYIYIVVMGISFLCVLCIYIKNMKINKFDILCLMFYAILAISTFKNNFIPVILLIIFKLIPITHNIALEYAYDIYFFL